MSPESESGRRASNPARLIAESGLLAKAEPVLVATSGGPDSSALLLALLEAGHPCRACVVDHGLRSESAREIELLRSVCDSLEVDLEVRRLEQPGVGRSAAALRDARYRCLTSAAEDAGLRAVATGHTMDDQAETVVLRLMQGAGTRGLAGIPPSRALSSRVRVVRPLLKARRSALRSWLEGSRRAFVDDPSNRDQRYARNRLRAEGLPLESALLAEVAMVCRRLTTLVDGLASMAMQGALQEDGSLDLSQLAEVAAPVRARLWRMAADFPLGQPHVDAVEGLVQSRHGSQEIHLPGGRVARREYGRLRFLPAVGSGRPERGQDPVPRRLSVAGPGRVFWPEAGMALTLSVVSATEIDLERLGNEEVAFDAARVSFPIEIRARRPGDRIRGLGAPGSRKVKDVLSDARVPRSRRNLLPIVVAPEGILWIPGLLRGDLAPLDESSSNALRISLAFATHSP